MVWMARTSYEHHQPFQCMHADTVQRERGLHLAVASMRRGERAHLWVSPEYGYGSSGSFSFPTVPPAAALTYDIELLDWEPPEEGKEQRDMLFEERVEVAERRRAEGNAAFKKGRYADALGRYRVALSFVDEDLLIQLQGFHYDKAMAARAPALLNMGACHLRLGEFHEAITLMGQVLAIDPGNSKALFRRGAARRALGQTEQAIDDLQAAKRAAPGDGGIARELAAAKADLREERQAAAQVFRGLVDKTDASKGLYGDAGSDGEEREEQQAAAVAGGGMGWLGGVLQALCPFIFGRGKAHAA